MKNLHQCIEVGTEDKDGVWYSCLSPDQLTAEHMVWAIGGFVVGAACVALAFTVYNYLHQRGWWQ
jgi:hypothetical protein